MVRFILSAVLLALPVLSSSADNCRPVQHAMGHSCVPLQPLRVAVLDTGELDTALALGVLPVAATTPYQVGNLPAYLPVQANSIASLGIVQEPDLERLLQLQPDLILGSKLRHGKIYQQLSAIAPTVFSESIGSSWMDNLKLFASALNRTDSATQWQQQFAQQCDRVTALYARTGRPPVSVVRSMQTHIRLYLPDSFIGSILQRCGIRRPPSQNVSGFAVRLRSPGKITQLDAPLILLSEYSETQGSLIQSWQQTPFWRLLEGKLHPVNDSYWMLGIGPIAAKNVLNDLQNILETYAVN